MKKKTPKSTALSTTPPPTAAVNVSVVAAALQKKANPAYNKLKTVAKIRSQADFDLVGEQLKFIKAIGKEVDAEEAKITDGIDKAMKELKASKQATQKFFQPFRNLALETETQYKGLMQQFVLSQEEKRLKLDKGFGTTTKSIATYTRKAEELNVKNGAAQVRNTKAIEIVDKKKIPLEYLIVDESAIKAALIAGVDVPGAKLINVKTIAV